MSNPTIDTIIIFTPSMQTLARFYQAAFDLGESNLSPGHIGFQMENLYLGFDQVEETAVSADARGTTLWFRVDDVDTTFAKLVELGATVRYTPVQKPWGDYLAALYDLDGNMIGVSQHK